MKNTAARLRRAQFFSAHISLQQGDSEAHLMWSGGGRRPERGTLGQVFACCQHVTCSLCHSNDTSWLRALATCASLMQTPSGKGSGNASFKYKTTFWCPNIWHLLKTIPETYKNYLTLLQCSLLSLACLLWAFYSSLHTMKRHRRSSWLTERNLQQRAGKSSYIYEEINSPVLHIQRISISKLFEISWFSF